MLQKLYRDAPIQRKLFVLSAALTLAALVLAGAVLTVLDSERQRDARHQRLATLAEVVAANSSAALVFGDNLAAEDTLSALRAEREIVAACLYDDAGDAFASYVRPGSSADCEDAGSDDQGLRYAVEIALEDEVVGSAVIRSESLSPLGMIARHAAVVALVNLLVLLVISRLGARLQRSISAPIQALAELARRVSTTRDYSLRVPRAGSDEVGVLVDSFNEMLEQIARHEHQLEQTRDELDEQVHLRTKELEQVIARLRKEIEYRERAEEHIRFLAYHDTVTGLPNREYVMDHLEEALARHRNGELQVGLLFLDLNRFKEVNDNFGHGVGDQLLVAVAQRLRESMRRSDVLRRLPAPVEPEEAVILSRQGGDEFIALIGGLHGPDDASLVARRLLDCLESPFRIAGHELSVGGSIGIAISPRDGGDGDSMLTAADLAMYRAKEEGGNTFLHFRPEMLEVQTRRSTIEKELREALELDQLAVHYQPQLDVRSGQLNRVEALVRWPHARRGMVMPGDFIDVAESSGLILPLGGWVLERACRDAVAWREHGFTSLRVAVNVAPVQFRAGHLLAQTRRILEETGFAGDLLELEVTETTLLRESDEVIQTLHELRDIGVRIALDDFGSGYSALSYLRRLPLDVLKIDATFVADLAHNHSIVRAVIDMAHSLDLQVVAEGVEHPEQLDQLRALGCDVVQGFVVARPMPEDELHEFLRARTDPAEPS